MSVAGPTLPLQVMFPVSTSGSLTYLSELIIVIDITIPATHFGPQVQNDPMEAIRISHRL